MDNSIVVIVDITYKDQHYNTVLNAVRECANDSAFENGCVRYDIYPDTNSSQKITLVEIWRDLESLEQHKTLPHYLQLQASLENTVQSVEIKKARIF